MAPIAIAKGLYELTIVRRNRMREEFKFAKDFICDVETNLQLHPYLKEKGYQAIAGTTQLGAEEIAYLLSLYNQEYGAEIIYNRQPDRALHDYKAGKRCLEFRPNGGDKSIVFRKKYDKNWKRKCRTIPYFLMYVIFVFLAAWPFFPNFLFKKTSPDWSFIALWILYFFPLACFFMSKGAGIIRAEHLIKNQHKRMQRPTSIIQPSPPERFFNHYRNETEGRELTRFDEKIL